MDDLVKNILIMAALLALSVTGKMLELQQAQKEANRNYADGHRLYIEGLMRQYPDRAWAADANFTIRLTYGQVLPYDPADGVTYHYYTTLRGVMEKEDPKNPTEFTVPDKLKELYAAQDFGAYANGRGELPVAFLANLDITGGNSGSPVVNADGELVGINFDRTWRSTMSDLQFDPAICRNIAVDIRYVLFTIDRIGGAGHLLKEMELR